MISKIHKGCIYLRFIFISFLNCAFKIVGYQYTRHTAKKMKCILGCANKIFFLLRFYSFYISQLAITQHSYIYFNFSYFTALWIYYREFFTGIINKHKFSRKNKFDVERA